ncbi:hypothetical protein [Actinomadura fibrosa]|uniref:Uncharacterized protein n=1 Tax=Actinomadura fibrosa TaxID=111802 RepID=A0ABW2XZT5_9ACTN|nr:hypothetical protein [Actinomadura fibrosa]
MDVIFGKCNVGEPLQVTDLDLFAIDFDPHLASRRTIGEVESGKGRSAPISPWTGFSGWPAYAAWSTPTPQNSPSPCPCPTRREPWVALSA